MIQTPIPNRPPITRLCCLKCGVESAIYDPRSNGCAGCGGMLFRAPSHPLSKAGKAFDIIFGGLFYGAYGIAILVAGGWWMIGLVLIVLALPFYVVFKLSPPAGLIGSMVLVAWALDRLTRPEAVSRREEASRRRRIKSELKRIPDAI